MTCPTHGADCPGHLHVETWEGGAVVVSQDGEVVSTSPIPPLDHPGWARLLNAINEEPRDLAPSHDDWDWPPAFHVEQFPRPDAGTRAAYNAAMVEAGGIEPQRAVVGVDPAGDYPTITAYADGTVSWADWEPNPFPWEVARAEAAMRQEVHDVVARHSTSQWVMRYSVWGGYWQRTGALPHEPPVPELTPPPPASGHASWFQPIAWPGYAQDEMLERLNLRWKYGHTPRTPDRARRAGVRP